MHSVKKENHGEKRKSCLQAMLASKQTCYNTCRYTAEQRKAYNKCNICTDKHHNEIHAYYNASSVWQSSRKANIKYPQVKQGSVTKVLLPKQRQ